jgi:hypothetical protein
MQIHACITYLHIRLRVPSIDGLTKRARRTRTHAAYSRIVSARTRSHAYARTHRRTHLHTWFLHRYRYTYIVPEVCVGYIYRRAHTRTRCHRPHPRRAQSHARAHGHDAATCTLTAYSSHEYTSIYRYLTRPSLYIDTTLCIPPWRDLHARTRSHAQALVATHMRAYVRHATRVIRMKATIYKYMRVAI